MKALASGFGIGLSWGVINLELDTDCILQQNPSIRIGIISAMLRRRPGLTKILLDARLKRFIGE